MLAGVDITLHRTVDDHTRGTNLTFDPPLAHHSNQGIRTRLGDNITLHQALDIEVATEVKVTDDHGIRGDQGGAARHTESGFLTSQHG